MEQPNPILLVAQTCCPHLLSLDDLLAIRSVCTAWRQSLSSAFCNTWRLPQSLWHTVADNCQFNSTIRAAAVACKHAPALLLNSGPGRPSIPLTAWAGLLPCLKPWIVSGGKGVARRLRLHMRNPPSPAQMVGLQDLPWLHALRLQHVHSAIYSRHLLAIAALTQLQELELVMEMPKLELRSLAHQRLRRVPLDGDILTSLVNLSRLEISCKAYTGDLLPDTLVNFSSPEELAALSSLTHLSISELALPGPWSVEQWLQPLAALKSLQFVMQDDPGANRGVAAGSSSTCSTGGAAGANQGLLGTGGLSAALAAAAQAAANSRADQQLAVAQQNLLAGLQNLSSALQQAANSGAFGRVAGANSTGSSSHTHQHHHYTPQQLSPAGPSASSSAGGAPAAGAGAGPGGQLARTNSSTSTNEADTPSAADAAAAAAASRPLLPVSFSSASPRLQILVLANLYGERLVKTTVPPNLTRLALHLANPSPGTVTGEQLAAVILQAADTLTCLELGLGMRFSLSGGVMRGLKRALKHLRELTLVEGAQDHLEGLGCWCNLPKLTLVEGRCTVPLRGLYELSMRAAMGRTPGVLRYHGHARHVEELASRLGSALQELRLDSLAGLGSGFRSGGGTRSSSSGSSCAGSSPGSPRTSKRQHQGPGMDSEDDAGSEDGAAGQVDPLPALAQLSCMTRLEVCGQHIGQLDEVGVLVLGSCKQLRVLSIKSQEPWLCADLGVKEQLDWLGQLPQLRQLRLAGVMLGRAKLSGANAVSAGGTAGGACPVGGKEASGKKGSGGGRGSNGGGKGAGGGSNSSSASTTAGAAAPAVKGLGNGLGCGTAAPSKGQTGRVPAVKDPEPGAVAIATPWEEQGHMEEPGEWEHSYAKMVSAAAIQFQDLQLAAIMGDLPAGAERTRALAFEASQQDAGVAACLEEVRRWLCEMLPICRVWLD